MKRRFQLRGPDRVPPEELKRAQEPAVLKEYVPASWFHAKGVWKVRARIEERLPNVAGSLFLTLTFDRTLFAGPREAFEQGRDHIRRMMYTLRQGVTWEGKLVQIQGPYCVKVEFHQDGWPHFHLVVRTRRFLPGGLLNQVWGFGRCNVSRITNEHFRYLLKYVTKGGSTDLPEWVLGMKRLRIWQTTKGFLEPVEGEDEQGPDEAEAEGEAESLGESEEEEESEGEGNKADQLTIGERLEKWARMAVLVHGETFTHLRLKLPWWELFDHLVYAIALDGRYLGNRKVQITNNIELRQWLSNQLPKMAYS